MLAPAAPESQLLYNYPSVPECYAVTPYHLYTFATAFAAAFYYATWLKCAQASIQYALPLHHLLFAHHCLFFLASLSHTRINLLTQMRRFGSSVAAVVDTVHFSVQMAPIRASFMRLTCNSGYFFEIPYSSSLWSWNFFLHLGAPVQKFSVHPLYLPVSKTGT